MEDWEGVRPDRPSRLRSVGLGFLAVVVVGGLVRPGGGEGPGGLLDVDRPAPSEEAAATAAASPRPRITRSPPPAPSPRPTPVELPARWEEGAPVPPEQPGEGAIAWNGRVFVYGGQVWDDQEGRATFVESAAVYDLEAATWTTLPPPPLEARSGPAIAWTGDELVVWGGGGRTHLFADGAAYDPDRGRWRVLAAGPLSPRSGAAAVWTGEDLLIAGGHDHAGGLADAARWDPETDRWSEGPPVASELARWGGRILAAAGPTGEALLWSPEQWGPEEVAPQRLRGDELFATILAEGDRTVYGIAPRADGSFLGIGSRFGANDEATQLVHLPVGSDKWLALDEEPIGRVELPTAAVAGDRYYVAVSQSGAVHAYDLDTGRWLSAPRFPGGSHFAYAQAFGLADGIGVVSFGTGDVPRPVVRRLVIEGEPEPAPGSGG